ncbi:hypothetical protein QTH97_30660 [Variovorax sp. J22R24]|uniref:hypothetical protein n=1 Tax=Variovorax gracilis TaxID=3053502 RepID=UPI002578553E|nr:hypothetical protein [Variovorax sp. J22R24]MDM0109328.1 hypothetical protein [Variovorax sp. J22R24]
MNQRTVWQRARANHTERIDMTNPSQDRWPFPTADSHQPLPDAEKPSVIDPTEEALDSGVEESFPASDPVSVTVSKFIPEADKAPKKAD